MRIQIRVGPNPTSKPLALPPSQIRITARPRRVLDFDVECRPLHFYGEYVSKEVTAVAWAWCDQPEDVTCYLLGEHDVPDILRAFRAAYDQADMVTGHFIRGFDLPLLNGAMTEWHLPPLSDKLTQDTKLDAVKRHGLSSSQENWGALLGLEHPKEQMNQTTWRQANRLTPEGIAEARRRVIGDVRQHIEMRRKMLALGYLAAPVRWRSGVNAEPVYTP